MPKDNDLILDAAGDIFYKSKDHQELGKFTIANPTSPKAEGSRLALRVEKENGELDWLLSFNTQNKIKLTMR